MSPTDSDLLDDYRWLLSHEAECWLAEVEQQRAAELVRLTARLRRELTPARAHLVLETGELRDRARQKFSRAAKMFFTRRGLEQSTDEIVAAYKAERFSGQGSVVDLCCGIGGDLAALAGQGGALGVDSDAIMALIAIANLPMSASTTVVCRQASADDLPEAGCWHIDPDRRVDGRRTTRAEYSSPPAEAIDGWRAVAPNVAIKLAPGAIPPDAWAEQAECEWISRAGECRQLVAWFGSLAQDPGRRAATILGRTRRTIRGLPDLPVPTATAIGRFVYDPDAAVLAAHLLGTLAEQHELTAVDPRAAYLTGDQSIDDPAVAGFEVLDVLPLESRQLNRYLREHRIGRLEIKKRGALVEPEQLRRQLTPAGDQAATLLLTPHAGRQIAIVARRIRSDATSE